MCLPPPNQQPFHGLERHVNHPIRRLAPQGTRWQDYNQASDDANYARLMEPTAKTMSRAKVLAGLNHEIRTPPQEQ